MHTLEILGDENGFGSKVISGNLAASTDLSNNIYVGIWPVPILSNQSILASKFRIHAWTKKKEGWEVLEKKYTP